MITVSCDDLAWGEDSYARPTAGTDDAVPDGSIADRDVPTFALLRSTMGLPENDPRWWPAQQPGRRRRQMSVAAPTSDLHHSVGHHHHGPDGRGSHAFPVISPRIPWGDAFAHPTVALLERTLAGLRAWSGGSSDVQEPQDLGHRLGAAAH